MISLLFLLYLNFYLIVELNLFLPVISTLLLFMLVLLPFSSADARVRPLVHPRLVLRSLADSLVDSLSSDGKALALLLHS